MSKKLSFDSEAMGHLYNGVSSLARAVKVTLGPKGRTVLISNEWNSPDPTKDGITVAKAVDLKHPIEAMAATLVREAANKTLEEAGDGTTSTTVLTEAIFKNAISYLTSDEESIFQQLKNMFSKNTIKIKVGSNSMDLKRGIDKGCELVIKELILQSKPVKTNEDIFNVARISGNNEEEIGHLISKAVKLVGNDGVILTEESPDSTSFVKLVEGISIDRGLLSPDFSTDESRSKATFGEPLVLLFNGTLNSVQDLIRPLEIAHNSERPLLIVAEDYDTNVIKFLVKNKEAAGVKVVAIKAPGMGSQKYERLKDLAAITNCNTLNLDNFNKVTIEDFGSASKVIVTKNETTLTTNGNSQELVLARIKELDQEISSCELDSMKDKLETRKAQLKGKLAIINLGARTESELKEKRDRLDDAVAATKSAIQEGIVAGSGLTLLRISKRLKGKTYSQNIHIQNGINAVLDAITVPAVAILENAGLDVNTIIKNILKSDELNYGFDSFKEEYTDLIKSGIIDPVKVTRLSLQNAGSISGVLLTTGCVISKEINNG